MLDPEKEAFLENARGMRLELLKLPFPRLKRDKLTRKSSKIFTGVKPGAAKRTPYESWRIEQLSKPTPRLVVKKNVGPSWYKSTNIHPSTLTGFKGTSRTQEMSRQTQRYLKGIKKDFAHLGPKFITRMDKQLELSWNTVYNWYRRQDLKKAQDLAELQPPVKKMSKEEKWKRIKAWCAIKALPVPQKNPPPLKREVVDIEEIRENMNLMSKPRFVVRKYKRPSKDPLYIDPYAVPPKAMTYKISARVQQLSLCPENRLTTKQSIDPYRVKKAALRYKASPRVIEIAIPKKTVDQPDMEVKENPFEVSPNALKYKVTPRIVELSKPTER